MAKISAICVFCGAQNGSSPEFRELAFAVGQLLASRDIKLVYGGSKDGLMGATADGALSKGGEVLGVLPRKLAHRELAHPQIQKLVTVDTMAQRKDVLMTESDAFLILPGGLGTLDELFEVLTANTLGFMNKPVFILNSLGYYTGLLAWLQSIAAQGLSRSPAELFTVVEELGDLDLHLS